MVSGDHFVCNSCEYQWRTRKDVGEPSVCPHCKSNHIKNESEKSRREQEDFRKEEERRKEQKLKEYNQKLSKLKGDNRLLYYLVSWRWILLTVGVVTTTLGIFGWGLIILSIIGFVKDILLKLDLESPIQILIPHPDSQIVARVGVKLESGYTYFVDEKGDVSRTTSNNMKQTVAKVGIKREVGYHYFVNDDGNIARRRG
ncbi:hypothetical protein HYT55_01920 [Candidatus Woesearchaeota archaeon]|nr:hypothetical protein [Candidatus Woesearchaeota archaeon]